MDISSGQDLGLDNYLREQVEGGKNDDNAWWKSWVMAAKSKSGEVLDFLKQDLNEISTTVQSEATNLISSTSSAIAEGIQMNNQEWSSATSSVRESVKGSVSSIISQVNQVLNPPPLDGDEEPYIIENDKVVSISKFQSKLYLLSASPNTYLKEIDKPLQSRYDAWLESLNNYEFNLLSHESLTKMLLTNSRLKDNYEKLVPEKVSHGDFWNRFLFRKALLEDEEAENLRKKSIQNKLYDSLEWEKELFGSHLLLSEEEQGQILLQYEKERSSFPKTEYTSLVTDKHMKSNTNKANISETSSVQSVNDRESSSDDWEKDFDLDEIGTIEN